MVLSIVEDHSFRLDSYLGLHSDIFEIPGKGAHIAANPGASMIAAIPYFVFRPLVDKAAGLFAARRGQNTPGEYVNPIQARVDFYREVRRRGIDIKFGLVCAVTMAFCMAPLSALCVLVLFDVLLRLQLQLRLAVALALLFAFGTPIFFRTAYLNHNLMVAVFSFFAFVLLWQPGKLATDCTPLRYCAAGLLAGLSFLCDYSGIITLGALGLYIIIRSGKLATAKNGLVWFATGALPPIIFLWFYQWRCFGHPFYPPQHYMPMVNPLVGVGYHGFSGFEPELLGMLLFDIGVGLFIASPLMILSLFAPLLNRSGKSLIPLRETIFILIFFAAYCAFFSSVQYTRLQWIQGIRYLVPTVPFLFLLSISVLLRLPRAIAYGMAILTIAVSWCMAMVRSDEGTTILESLQSVFSHGPQLPWLKTLSNMPVQYVSFLNAGTSAISFFLIWSLLIYVVWRIPFREKTAG